MPSLYRCRTSLGEVAALFAATPPPRADWSAELWPGRTGLVVRRDGEERRIDAMRWGADLPAGAADFPRHRRSELWFRELWPAHAHLLAPEARCLIVVEEFALPDGPAGARARTWYGFDNPPLFAWAGVWTRRHPPPPCPRSIYPKVMMPGLAVICASLAASRGSNARTMPCIANRPKRRGAPTARREARAGNGGWPPSDIKIARRSSAPLEKPLQARVADEGRATDLHHIDFALRNKLI